MLAGAGPLHRGRMCQGTSVGRAAAKTRRRSRNSIQFARRKLGRIAPLHAGVRIAIFGCDVPPRCGAFADERRVVASNVGYGCEREALIQSGRAVRLSKWVMDLGVRVSLGRVAAKRVEVPAVRSGSRGGSAN
jgi:hypothetical protein